MSVFAPTPLLESYSHERGVNSKALPTREASRLPYTQAEQSSVVLGKVPRRRTGDPAIRSCLEHSETGWALWNLGKTLGASLLVCKMALESSGHSVK